MVLLVLLLVPDLSGFAGSLDLVGFGEFWFCVLELLLFVCFVFGMMLVYFQWLFAYLFDV